MSAAESSPDGTTSRLTIEDLTAVDHLCWHCHDTSKLDTCLKHLSRRSAEIAGAKGAAILILDPASGRPQLKFSFRMEAKTSLDAFELAERVLDTSGAITSEGGLTVVPMSADGIRRGAIILGKTRKPLCDEAEEDVRLLGERAAFAIGRAQECREVYEHLEVIDGLVEVSEAVMSEKDLSKALQMVAQKAAMAVKAEVTGVGLIDWNTKELHYVESFGEIADKVTGARFPLTKSVRALVTKSGQTVVINDAATDERIPREVVEQWGIRSLLVVPMKVRKKVIGVLVAANRHGGPFAGRDLRVFETIANHGAAAVAHAELHARADAALTELEAEKTQVEAVLTQLGDGVVVCDATGKVIMINAAAQKILGHSMDDTVGRHVVDIHSPGLRPEISFTLKQLMQSKPQEGLFWEQNIPIPGGKVARINVRPVFLRNGKFVGTAALVQDVTQQVELDEAKTEFISTVAHELRTPLTALKGSLGLILGGAAGEIDANLRDLMDIAENNCNRLIRLVDDMLDMAKIETGHLSIELEVVSVQDRVLNAVRQMRHLAQEKQIKLQTKVTGRPPSIVGDGDRIEQVTTNLLSNAIKFAPADSIIEVLVKRAGSHVKVSVTDQGPGVPAAEQKKVFEKFYQVSGGSWQKEGGSGLGLAISKAIIDQHGGRICVRSTGGRTTFTFLLPLPGEDTTLSDKPDE